MTGCNDFQNKNKNSIAIYPTPVTFIRMIRLSVKF